MSDDDSRYRVSRRTPQPNRDTLRDVVPPIDLAAPQENAGPPSSPGLAVGSRAGVSRVTPPALVATMDDGDIPELEFELEIAEPGLLVERRQFGGHEVVIQHRGDEVTFILPGAVRLVGTRDEAIDLIRAFLAKPGDIKR